MAVLGALLKCVRECQPWSPFISYVDKFQGLLPSATSYQCPLFTPSLLCDPHRDPPWHSGYMPGSQACVPRFFKSRMAWSLYRHAQFRCSINGASAIMFIPSLLCDPHRDPPWHSGYMPGSQACVPKFFKSRMAWSLYRHAQFRSSINGASAIMFIPSLLCDPHRDPPWHSGYMPGSQACVPKFFKSRMAWSLYRHAQFRSSINGASAIMFIPSLLCDPHRDPPWHSGYMPGSQACIPKFFI